MEINSRASALSSHKHNAIVVYSTASAAHDYHLNCSVARAMEVSFAEGTAEEALSTFTLRPRFKISELPLVKEQRSTIDVLLNKFKKQGGYDALRKQVWAAYNTSEAKLGLTQSISAVAEA